MSVSSLSPELKEVTNFNNLKNELTFSVSFKRV
jgi:hypothetical protein